MKYLMSAIGLACLAAGCAGAPDTARTIEACRKITDKNFRDRCIADALREAENEAREEEVFGSDTD